MKPYLVMQYLLKYSDENHTVTALDIVAYLEENCGITAERRSIRPSQITRNIIFIAVESVVIPDKKMLGLRKELKANTMKMLKMQKSGATTTVTPLNNLAILQNTL